MDTPEMAPQSAAASQELTLKERISLAAVCVIPVADLVVSDGIVAKLYAFTQEHAQTTSELANHLVPDATITSFIFAQSIALGVAITRTERLRGAAHHLDRYNEDKRQNMTPLRRAVSKIGTAPYAFLEKVGGVVTSAGEKIAQRRSGVARAVGRTAMDEGLVNAIGTSGVILKETLEGSPPSLKRMAWLSGLIAGTWLAGVEGARELYHAIPEVRLPISASVHAFEAATSVNSPVGAAVLGVGTLLLGRYGWNLGESYQQQKEQAPQTDL
jgi:hypothetical protein